MIVFASGGNRSRLKTRVGRLIQGYSIHSCSGSTAIFTPASKGRINMFLLQTELNNSPMKQMNQHILCFKTELFGFLFLPSGWKGAYVEFFRGIKYKTRLPMFWLRGKVVSSKRADISRKIENVYYARLLCDKGITIYLTIMSCEWRDKKLARKDKN